MSSSDVHYDNANGNEDITHNAKRRKRPAACDICRRKKVRCDGVEMPGRRCSPCATFDRECTYNGVALANDRYFSKKYVAELEARIENLEHLLSKSTCPKCGSATVSQCTESDALRRGINPFQQISRSLDEQQPMTPTTGDSASDDQEASDDELLEEYTLIQTLRTLQLNPDARRFLGKSSSAFLVRSVFNTKREQLDGAYPYGRYGQYHRPQFWNSHPWLLPDLRKELPPHSPDNFPEPDLMHELIDLYFMSKNMYMPLLHRPTFESNVADGLHLRDQGFGSTVLLVCAIGARYTEDPRVYLPGYENDPLARGWKWFNIIHNVKRTWLSSPTLYDLQLCCLLVQFMESTSAPHATWSIIGVGIRLAQDVGAHRKKVYNQQHRAEEELWKRAFWVLVLMDRALSAITGRPCAMQDEDFDIDFLTECDDEFWMHSDPTFVFKQPPGKPSTVAFFNCSIRLSQILAFVQRTIYSSKKLKTMMGITGPEWEERIVRELDSALNRWLDTVPEHLRWNPSQEDDIFLNQSAHLYITYYQLQIFIHRPYLQSPHRRSSQAFPSLAICTNAARACIHILGHQYKRTEFLMFSDQTGLFVSGIVLLLNIWGSKRSSITIDVAKEMADVQKCMDLLKIAEKHWYFAGRGWDILHELAYVGDLPPLMQSPFPSRKRDRNGDVAGSAAANHTSRQDFTLRRSSGDNRPDDRSSSSALSIREQTRIASESERNAAGTYRASIIPASLHSLNLDAEVHTMFGPSGSNAQPENVPQQYQTNPIAPTAHDASDPLLQNNSFSVQDPLLSALWLPQDQGNSNPTPPPNCSIMAPDSTGATAHLSIAQANSTIMGMHAPSNQGDAGGWSTPLTNDDLFSMLSSMPIGFEWNDWDAYIGTMSGMSDAQGSDGFEKIYSDKNNG